MIHYLLKSQDISTWNIVCVLNNENQLQVLDFLGLQDTIVKDIKKHLKKKESINLEYFLGGRKYSKLFILIDLEQSSHSSVLFLWKHFPKLPDALSLILPESQNIVDIVELALLSRYSFQNYLSKKTPKVLELVSTIEQKKVLQNSEEKVKNIFLARDLWETPAHDLTPEIFAWIVKKNKFNHIKVKVLTYKDIQKKWLGLIEWVWKWSVNKPYMVILEHIRNKKNPITGIIGKWVTYDTWWNQIKPWDFMYDMKGDMWGAAVVYSLMKEIDRQYSDKNFVACLMLAENVVSSNAYKPSDILKWYTGKTVEIIHTDAEWRLVLADGISYIGKNYKTQKMISIATLTWACMVALWYRYAWVMGTDEELISQIIEYSKTNCEKYIQLPFDDYFVEKTKSKIADFNNLERSVHAGSSMGAAFLYNFLENKESYTHIDIAGAYINEWEAYGKMPKWMTGFWVESLSTILLK